MTQSSERPKAEIFHLHNSTDALKSLNLFLWTTAYGMPAIGPFKIDNKTYLTLQYASRVIGPVIAEGTLHNWARRGHTPWDLDLDIIRQPVLTHAKRRTATRRDVRLLISEESTLLLRRLLHDYRRNPRRPMRLTNDELFDLKAASPHCHP
jgi:hypothetical protein